ACVSERSAALDALYEARAGNEVSEATDPMFTMVPPPFRVQQSHLVAQLLDLAPSVVRRAAGLQQHIGGWVLGEPGPEGRPREAPALPHLPGHGRDGDLEDGLGKIDADL